VDRLDGSHDPDLRPPDRRQLGDLAADVHAHLEDRGLVVRPHAQHGQRQPDLVVLIALVLECRQLRGEDRRDRFLRRGLGNRPRHADHERVEPPPPARRDRVQRAQRIGDLDDRRVDVPEGDAVGRPGDDRGRRTRLDRGGDIRVTVDVLPR
jgi:hypothetical protein